MYDAGDRDEVRVPKEAREFVPDWAEETVLGEPQGSRRQYRYGNLHIREYDDCYTVHADRVDPRRDPLGHLIRDAPEVLIGAGCGLAAGALAYAVSRSIGGNSSSRDGSGETGRSLLAAAAAAAASGYASYAAAKEVRRRLRRRSAGV
ncbi:MAG: hypothetical protein J4F28_02410 [Nitrosopumilaceae archaeon]|nr:hypothetical protein [Nitrosopumilaceae archaeon]